MPKICSQCHSTVDDAAAFCDICGAPFQPAGAPPNAAAAGLCPSCGSQNMPGEVFCNNCGMQLPPVVVSPPPPPYPIDPSAGGPPPGGGVFPGGSSQSPIGGGMPGVPSGVPPANPWGPGPTPGGLPPAGPAAGGLWAGGMPGQNQTPVNTPGPQWGAEISGRFVVAGSNATLAFPGGKTELLIGRADPDSRFAPDIDTSLVGGDVAGVSRRHARLVFSEGRVFIEDTGSTNFTFINRQRLSPGQRAALNNGDEVRLGRLVMIYYA